MYTLFIGNKNYSSWSLRPWVLMQALGIPFEERLFAFETTNWDTFREFSPTGKVPCLHDGATAVWDSLGIAEYLAEKHPGVWPPDRLARAWARCAAAEMHSGFAVLREKCPMNCGIRVQIGPMSDALRRDVDRIGELWTEGLSRFGGPFLAGEAFTAADAFYAPVAYRVQSYAIPLPEAAASYAARLLDLPAMRQWYTAALAEPWREQAHEEEARAAGTWLRDLRTTS